MAQGNCRNSKILCQKHLSVGNALFVAPKIPNKQCRSDKQTIKSIRNLIQFLKFTYDLRKVFGSCISLRDRCSVDFVGGYKKSYETSKRLWHHCGKISLENTRQFPNHIFALSYYCNLKKIWQQINTKGTFKNFWLPCLSWLWCLYV